jgi:hypothetical protein
MLSSGAKKTACCKDACSGLTIAIHEKANHDVGAKALG